MYNYRTKSNVSNIVEFVTTAVGFVQDSVAIVTSKRLQRDVKALRVESLMQAIDVKNILFQ